MPLMQGQAPRRRPDQRMTLSGAERVGHPKEMKHEIVLSCKRGSLRRIHASTQIGNVPARGWPVKPVATRCIPVHAKAAEPL